MFLHIFICMKYILLILLSVSLNNLRSQTPYKFDYVETFDVDWSGIWWTPITTTNYYTNASVSPTTSAVLYGTGGGSSVYESDWYSFPNLVVDPGYDYQFKFRLGSYRFTSTATTRGVDIADYITVQLSTDGGSTYTNELRVTGNSNAYWNYNTSGVYTKTANGTLTTIGPSAGGDRTATGDGYSVIQLNIPPGTSQIAIDIFSRANASGEEWWMDNFELIKTGGPLPVELIYFEGTGYENYNLLRWSTATEHNSDYFSVQRSSNGIDWSEVVNIESAGNSTEKIEYSYIDNYPNNGVVYYKLIQYDFDGKFKEYGPISITYSKPSKKVVKFINTMGQEVDSSYKGIMIVVYDDLTTRKIIKW